MKNYVGLHLTDHVQNDKIDYLSISADLLLQDQDGSGQHNTLQMFSTV